MRFILAAVFALLVGSAHAYPLSCWSDGAATLVTIAGYQGASKRISATFNLRDVPLGQSVQNLSAAPADVSISSIEIVCRDEKPAAGVRAVDYAQQMFLETSAKLAAGTVLPVPIWVDEGPGFRRVTIGGKP